MPRSPPRNQSEAAEERARRSIELAEEQDAERRIRHAARRDELNEDLRIARERQRVTIL